MSWDKRQFKAFAKDIKDAYPGKAWGLLVDEMREAVLCERVLRIVLGQDKEAIKVEDIQTLYQGVREEMGQLSLWIDDQHREESMRVFAERKAKRQPKSSEGLEEAVLRSWQKACPKCKKVDHVVVGEAAFECAVCNTSFV